MHLIITDAWLARARPVHLTGTRLVLGIAGISLGLMLLSATLYHWVFLKAAREGWPVISGVVKLIAKDEFEQQERFVKENLSVMAQKVGEIQARLLQMEALAERLGVQAGIPAAEMKALLAKTNSGGPLVNVQPLDTPFIHSALERLHTQTDQHFDLFYYTEAQLFEKKMKTLTIPTRIPIAGGVVGSGFGWRIDPFTHRSAQHTGVDFQADRGTPILAAAGGMVVAQELHDGYGNMVDIDHGNNIVSRYAHAETVFVKKGDLVKRGQKIATVGTTGRSTGPHLHFEVLLNGVPQDPKKFLNAGMRSGGGG